MTSNETTVRGSYGFNRAEFAEGTRLAVKHAETMRQFISGSCSLEETPGVMDRLAHSTLQATKMVIHPQANATGGAA